MLLRFVFERLQPQHPASLCSVCPSKLVVALKLKFHPDTLVALWVTLLATAKLHATCAVLAQTTKSVLSAASPTFAKLCLLLFLVPRLALKLVSVSTLAT